MNKMERFNQRARRVLSLAQEEAQQLHHGMLDTQHLLLGMMLEEGGVAGRVLRQLGLNANGVREMVEKIAPGNTHHSTEPPELSPGSKRVLELAVDEARRIGHHYIGTEHLLLGLAGLTEGGAMQFLKRNGISPEEIRRETRRLLQESPLSTKPTETEAPSVSPLVQTSLSEYIVRVVVRDAATKEQKLEFNIRLDRAQLELAHMTRKIFQGKEVDPIEWTSGDNLIAVVVEKPKE